jgi:hypothetical protein
LPTAAPRPPTSPRPAVAPRPTTSRPSPSKVSPRPTLPKPSTIRTAAHDDETRLSHLDSLGLDDPTRAVNGDDAKRLIDDGPPRFRAPVPVTDPQLGAFEDHRDPDEATKLASLEGIAAMERARHGPSNDERTRAVNIRNDPSISDIDWDLD